MNLNLDISRKYMDLGEINPKIFANEIVYAINLIYIIIEVGIVLSQNGLIIIT